mmetsp:Transcript_6597/g.7557  ORF Transcript_6597/g.7557 Transcript_6597/m.7557 type:complete len:348 (+) Transcript_6597:361-1404(+)
MGSSLLCTCVSLYGMLKYSWHSFKILKTSCNSTPVARESAKVSESFCVLDGENIVSDGEIENESEETRLIKFLEESKRRDKMKSVLHFWVVFAFITMYEYYIEIFVFWIPFYYTLKFAFLLWIMSPQTNGASTVFKNVLEPRLLRHQYFIDNILLQSLSRYLRNTVSRLEDLVIGSVINDFLTDEQLEELCMYYEEKLNRLVVERNRRNKEAEGESVKSRTLHIEKSIRADCSNSGSWVQFSNVFSWAWAREEEKNEGVSDGGSVEKKYVASSTSKLIEEAKPENSWISAGLKEVVTLAYATGNIILRNSSDTGHPDKLAVEQAEVTTSDVATSPGEKTEEQSIVRD